MSVARNQQQISLQLLRALQPYWRSDPALPSRIQALLARNKAFGSRDRRLYRELLYTGLRYLPWIEPLLEREPERATKVVAWLAAELRETSSYRTEVCGDWPAAGSLAERAAFLGFPSDVLLPAWMQAECAAVFEPAELEVQLTRAPLWLRLQTAERTPLEEDFLSRGWQWRESKVLTGALQILGEADVTKTAAYTAGDIEIQDLGSQLVLESVGVQPGGLWLDACAGAGGKSLQLARLTGPTGRVDAHDIRTAALAELRARAERAHLSNVTIRPGGTHFPEASYDGVLVDAPCSGSGTWRRSPHLKWTTSAASIADKARLQGELLRRFAPLVRRGGVLVYATCSLARSENETVIARFLEERRDFERMPLARTFGFAQGPEGMTIMPARHDTDGFFVSALRRGAAG